MSNGLGFDESYEAAPMLERELVAHVIDTTYDRLPAEAIEAARKSLLWFVGNAIAGARAPGSEAIARFADGRSAGVSGGATLFGYGRHVAPDMAGFANACFGKAHEFEDKYWLDDGGGFAIGFAVVPAAIATAEQRGAVSGERLLEAVAVATDVQARLLGAVKSSLSPETTGWNSTYLFANYGTTVAAAKVLGVSAGRLIDALGLAHAQGAGNFQGQMEGVLGIRMQAGFSVRNGMQAVGLASLGISGARAFISGRFGLYNLHFAEHPVDLSSLTHRLGVDYLGSRLGFKGYPCGVVAHPVLDAVRLVREKADLAKVKRVMVSGSPRLAIMARPVDQRRNPRNGVEAQFSLPWTVACMLVDGNVDLRHFEPDALSDGRYRSVASRVDVEMDDVERGAVVELEMADGSTVRSPNVRFGRGHPENPLTLGDMMGVYRESVARAPMPIDEEASERALDGLVHVERYEDVRDLFQLFSDDLPVPPGQPQHRAQ